MWVLCSPLRCISFLLSPKCFGTSLACQRRPQNTIPPSVLHTPSAPSAHTIWLHHSSSSILGLSSSFSVIKLTFISSSVFFFLLPPVILLGDFHTQADDSSNTTASWFVDLFRFVIMFSSTLPQLMHHVLDLSINMVLKFQMQISHSDYKYHPSQFLAEVAFLQKRFYFFVVTFSPSLPPSLFNISITNPSLPFISLLFLYSLTHR